jgi:two-component system sensor histidine kinase YesM
MKLAESGDFDTQIKVKSKDEIGELSLSFNKMLTRIKQLIQRVYQTEIVRKEAELSALQAQINPHFLYNTLQIMDIMAEEKGADEISGACQSLAKIFRYSISKVTDLVALKVEIIHVEKNVFIKLLRLGEKLSVEYNLDESLYRYEIIKLILQPLVENAIIHGIEKDGRNCVIKVSASLTGDNLILSVEDNGVGMTAEELMKLQSSLYQDTDEERPKRHGGIALKNVNDRIRLYYNDKYGMSIQSKKHKGTKVTLILPARLYTLSESEDIR